MSLISRLLPELQMAQRLLGRSLPTMLDPHPFTLNDPHTLAHPDPKMSDMIKQAYWTNIGVYPIDVRETPDAIVVEAELPGIPRDRINAEFVGDSMLNICTSPGTKTDTKSIKNQQPKKSSDELPDAAEQSRLNTAEIDALNATTSNPDTFRTRMRMYYETDRYITLSSPVDPEKASANLADGLLRIVAPKRDASPRQRTKLEIH